MSQKANRILEEIGIAFDPDKRVADMTMAEKEAVEISKAMLQRPKILILDEVTAPLDSVGVKHLFQIIHTLKSSGIGIIYISHRLREVFEISDAICVLRDGRKVGTLNPKKASKEDVIKMMVGEEGVLTSQNGHGEAPTSGRELLRCENLSYKNFFTRLSMNLSAHEIVGLAGLKGAGRSQFVKTLFGLLKAEEGDMYINDQKVEIHTPLQAMEAGIGYIPGDRQQEGLALIRSVGENISITTLDFFSSLFGVLKPGAIRAMASRIVRHLNVKPPSLKNAVGNLSGGNQQKVMIGKWIKRDLPILIFEEPTRGVDVKSKAEIH